MPIIEALLARQMERFDYVPERLGRPQLGDSPAHLERLWTAQRTWEDEEHRRRSDHVAMHRGTYKRMLEAVRLDPEV